MIARPSPSSGIGVCAVAVLCTVAFTYGEPRVHTLTLQQEAARISVPPVILFEVHDPRATTEALTGSTTITFDDAVMGAGRVLRISVKADGDLTRADGAPVPAAKISWRTSAASNGVGVNGVLSKSVYTQVFQGNAAARSGSVNVTWSIAFDGTRTRAGSHQVVLRWRIDSIVP
jgi:hypothetical protein